MNNRLACLKQLVHKLKTHANKDSCTGDDEKPLSLKLSLDNLHPFSFPIFKTPDHLDELAPHTSAPVPVRCVPVLIKAHVPFFKLKVPQHYKLMGYQQVSAFQALDSFLAHTLTRPLRVGAEDELLAAVITPSEFSLSETKSPECNRQNQAVDLLETPLLSAPSALLQPPHNHTLRIFNPSPGLHTFKQPPRYLECDPEYHLCPLPRYPIYKEANMGLHTGNTQRKFLDHTEVIRGVMTWKKFQSAAVYCLSSPPNVISSWTSHMNSPKPEVTATWLSFFSCVETVSKHWDKLLRSDPFNGNILPYSAPPVLDSLPEELKKDLIDGLSESEGGVLTPEMLRAEFPLPESATCSQPQEGMAKYD
ncbi:hypothetical protein JZ751_028174, partial [Albula glossodonta]